MARLTKEQREKLKEIDIMIAPLPKPKKKRKRKSSKLQDPIFQPPPADNSMSHELLKKIMSGESQITQEQAAAIVMTSLTDRKIIDMHSDLTENQIMTLTAMTILQEVYDEDIYRILVSTFEPKMVSKGREGRKELIAMVKALAAQKQELNWKERLRSIF